MKFKNWTNEERLNVCRMRIDGYSLQDIGDQYGVTREYIRQVLQFIATGRDPSEGVGVERIVYANIKKWMVERGMSINTFARSIKISGPAAYMKLYGKNDFSLKELVKIRDLTCFSLDQILEKAGTKDAISK